jgi:hypothetical protein
MMIHVDKQIDLATGRERIVTMLWHLPLREAPLETAWANLLDMPNDTPRWVMTSRRDVTSESHHKYSSLPSTMDQGWKAIEMMNVPEDRRRTLMREVWGLVKLHPSSHIFIDGTTIWLHDNEDEANVAIYSADRDVP